MNTKLNKITNLTTGQIMASLSEEQPTIEIAANDNFYLDAFQNHYKHGFGVKLHLRGGGGYSVAGYASKDKKPSVDEIITLAENYIQNVILKTPAYTPPKYATKDAEIAALRNALTLIKSLSTPPNLHPWEVYTAPKLSSVVDKIATIAKEAL